MARLLELRSSIDESFARLDETAARERFDHILARVYSYLVDGDVERYENHLHRWLAVRAGEGATPEAVVHAAVALGDVIVEVVRERVGSDDRTTEFVREIARLNYRSARLIGQVVAGELARLSRRKTEPVEIGE